MKAHSPDTIYAIATPPVPGAVGILRLSGPKSRELFRQFFKPAHPQESFPIPRSMHFGRFYSVKGDVLDEGLGVYFPAPNSYTGEDVVEFQGHGNPHLLRLLCDEIKTLANSSEVRLAEPGEFTRRAFLNGRMDLSQAESVHALITAESAAAAKMAFQSLEGILSSTVNAMREKICEALAHVEASFEFVEEDLQTHAQPEILRLIEQANSSLKLLLNSLSTSRFLESGVHVALVGRPNVGKSSLFNFLLVDERSIVTPIPGTTRDVVEGRRWINDVLFVFRDTAGLRETDDVVEKAGIKKTFRSIHDADVILWLTDDALERCPAEILDISRNKILYRILSKSDLFKNIKEIGFNFDFSISNLTGSGHSDLEKSLGAIVSREYNVQNYVHTSIRQKQCLMEAEKIFLKILETLSRETISMEILAEELRDLVRVLGEVTGVVTSEDILGEIFKRFCIGK